MSNIQVEKLVWTNSLEPGFRPAKLTADDKVQSCGNFAMTAVISLMPNANGATYSALVMHTDKESRLEHEKMGFQEGWSGT